MRPETSYHDRDVSSSPYNLQVNAQTLEQVTTASLSVILPVIVINVGS